MVQRALRADGTPRGTSPSRRQLAVGFGYVAASGLYIAIGIWIPDFLFSVFVAIAYLLAIAWLVPAGIRRLL